MVFNICGKFSIANFIVKMLFSVYSRLVLHQFGSHEFQCNNLIEVEGCFCHSSCWIVVIKPMHACFCFIKASWETSSFEWKAREKLEQFQTSISQKLTLPVESTAVGYFWIVLQNYGSSLLCLICWFELVPNWRNFVHSTNAKMS